MSIICKCKKGLYLMKKNIGVIKDIDKLGRIVIPKEFRERLKLENRVEVLLTENGVLIRNSEYMLVKKDDLKN